MTSITNSRKNKRFEAIFENLEKLKAIFPKAFTGKGVPTTPLKIGINDDLNKEVERLGLGLSKGEVQNLLSFWCSRGFYLKAFSRNTHRIDLQGNPVQEISDADRNLAKTRLAAIKAKRYREEATFSPEESAAVPASAISKQ